MAGNVKRPLPKRQMEILSLVAAGLSNPEIAERLVISRRTVDNTLLTVFARLGVENRVQAARWYWDQAA